MKIRPFLLLAAGMAFALASVCTQAGPSAEAILQKALSASDRLAFEGRQMVTMWLSDRKTEATITYEYHHGRNRYRIEYLAPRRARGRLVITDGKSRWQYEPASRRASVEPAGADDGREAFFDFSLALLKSNYRFEMEPKGGAVAGRRADIVHILPRHTGKPSQTLWVDSATGLILKIERTHHDGSLTSVSAYTEIHFKPSLPASLFTFNPGRGIILTAKGNAGSRYDLIALRRRFGSAIFLPRRLACGYRFCSAGVTSLRGKTAVQMNYTDGLNTLTLIQVPQKNGRLPARSSRIIMVGSQKGTLASGGHFEVLTWPHPSAPTTLSLIGDMSEAALIRVARSVSPESPNR
ncbi:MAG: hypothetical protein IT210_25960 [Armatimonadetes bacterium]|nr:hypothetical protein [Armatimonadota bacterium]